MTDRTLTVGSLFSGIGGLDLGLEWAGMQVAWQAETDPWCAGVLARHWPDVPNHGDVTALNPASCAPVDLICGGFPCQPVSQAGLRKGRADERWLWPAFARVVGDLRPRWVLVENTPGLRSARREMGGILADLAALGYDTEWESITAAALGAPHRRDRIFIVAYPDSFVLREPAFSVFGRCDPPQPSDDGPHWSMADTDSPRGRRGGVETGPQEDLETLFCPIEGRGWWGAEPDVGRVVHGVSAGMDRRQRTRGLGNAVVPQVAHWLGQQILRAEHGLS